MAKRIIVYVMAIMLVIGMAPSAMAESETGNGSSTKAGAASVADDSRFAGAITGEKTDGEPCYRYSDRWFTESSYALNRHLAALTSYAAVATFSYKKKLYDNEDATGASGNGVDVIGMLSECGFKDVQTNKYYFLDTEENSMGCVAGHKELNVRGKKYTLLAIFPASPKYGQEWAGNFTVGKGGIHEGFKAGRDEVLRFLRNYISEHNIKGDLKVWITGFSRFSAAANLLAGFIAGGGAGYLGDVTVSPKNVYGYVYAPPATIKPDTATKRDALSVEGYRGTDDPRYRNDSAGEAYTYQGEDADEIVDPHDSVFNGIRNCKADYDLVPMLPPQKWGLDRYGRYLPISDGKATTKQRMLVNLERFYPDFYKEYMDGGDEEDYKWKTFDFSTMAFVDDTSCQEEITQEKMFRQRVDGGITRRGDSAAEYVDGGYQDMLRSTAAAIGMCPQGLVDGILDEPMDLAKGIAFSYLSYAAARMETERGYDEDKAIAVAVEELVEFITGQEIDPDTFTVDNFVEMIAKYIAGNASYEVVEKEPSGVEYDAEPIEIKELVFKSKTAEEVFKAISYAMMKSIPEESKQMIPLIIDGFDPAQPIDSEHNKEAIMNFVFTFLSMCAYGDGDKDNPNPEDAKFYRSGLYNMLNVFMGSGQYKDIIDAIGSDGSKNAAKFLDVLMGKLMVETNESGVIIKRYDNVDDAADAYAEKMVDDGIKGALASGRYEEGSEHYNELKEHGDVIKEKVTEFRQVLMDLLFFERDSDGSVVPFNTERNIRTLSTFVSQAKKIIYAHWYNIYDAWMKAQDTVELAREDMIELLEVVGAENADKVINKDKFENTILKAEKDVQKAATHEQIEKIFADVITKTDNYIREKKEADRQAAEEAAREAEEKACEAEREAADTAAAEAVMTKIQALPEADDVTTADKEAINAARAVYDLLTENQKAKISVDLLEKLIKAENALKSAEEAAKQVDITDVVLAGSSFTYNGEVIRPEISYVIAGDKVVSADGYDVAYSEGNSIDAGKYTLIVVGKDRFKGVATADYTITKAANPVTIKGGSVTVRYKKVSKKAKTVKRARAITIKNKKTKITYKLSSVRKAKFKSFFKVYKKTGNILVRKGLKAGTYRLNIKVSAAEGKNYKARSKTVTVKVRIK